MDIVPRILVMAATTVLVVDNKSATADFGHEIGDLVVDRTYFFFLIHFTFFWDFFVSKLFLSF